MTPNDRNTLVDMVAQAVIDKMDERERTNKLADLVVQRVIALQKKKPHQATTRHRRTRMETNNETAIISDPQTPREKFEQARLSRRAALRKIGITSGMALFGMFAVDDLARMAIKKMEENTQTHEIGETVAKEFRTSGIAFADASSITLSQACGQCYQTGIDAVDQCSKDYPKGGSRDACNQRASDKVTECLKTNNCPT